MALTKWQPPALRHHLVEDGRITWLELFFDLIYVAALIQLGDQLSDDVSWTGVGRFLAAFVVLWWTWTGTTAFMNRFAVDDVAHRLLTFVQMFAVGNFAVIATTTDIDRPQWLVFAYIAARLPLLIMYIRVRYVLPETRRLTDLYLGCFSGSVALWALSLLLPTPARYWIWVAALVVEFLAPVIGANRTDAPPSHSEHFQERYALFTIIVLGETFVKTISEIVDIGISTQTQVFGALAFIMLIALWWTYFDDVAESHIRNESPISGKASTNRLLWVYAHLPLSAALTAFGVASKKIVGVEAFADTFRDSYTWLLIGALVTVLVAVAALDAVTVSPHYAIEARARIGSRLIAAVALVPLGGLTAAGAVSATVGLSLIVAVVVAQIASEVLSALRSERRLEQRLAQDLPLIEGTCDHLTSAMLPERTEIGLTCTTCEELGLAWVKLRLCLSCGHVGCCDDSKGRHAEEHHTNTLHPVIASLEDGDQWAYCYADDTLDPVWQLDNRPGHR